MALTTITKKVLNLSEIPSTLLKNHWIALVTDIQLQEVHIDDDKDGEKDRISEWVITTYPELKKETSFYIDLKS